MTNKFFDQALAAFQGKNYSKAGKLCDRALKMQPLNYDALHLAGLLAVNKGDKLQAVEFIQNSLAIQPSQPSAHNNIGNIYRKLERFDDAINAFREAVRQKPDFADAWANMAIVYYDQDDFQNAADRAGTALKLEPDHMGATHTMGLVHLNNNNLDGVADAFVKCSGFESTEGFSPLWYAQALAHLERLEEAKQILSGLLEKNPDDSAARFQYDAIAGTRLHRVPEDAVRDTFDQFASNFDKVLKNLDYRAPELVAAQVIDIFPNEKASLVVADLGCGTGLVGPLLRPIAKKLIGVDLSPKMLLQAKQNGTYDELVESDLTAFLDDGPADRFQLITCADTLIYLGGLEEVMLAVNRALIPGGYLVATLETGDDIVEEGEPYLLHNSGRFVHTEEYLRTLLINSGLTLHRIRHEDLRNQGGKPVKGMIFSATLQNSDSA